MNYRYWIAEYKLIPIAAALGFVGWSGNVMAMLGLPMLVWIWRIAPSRRIAFMALLAYYLVADRGLLRGAAVFFSDPLQKPSLIIGLAIWIAPSLLLALTWAVLWGSRLPVVRLGVILLLISVPPIGIVGWANPLTAAGAWFPGSGWWGLIAFLSLLLLLVSASAWRCYGVALAVVLAVTTNMVYTAPENTKWIPINTQFQPSKNDAGEYSRLRQLLAITDRGLAHAVPGSVIVLPEAVGGNWEVNGPFWEQIGEAARRKNVTVLVGGRHAIEGVTQDVNGLFSVGFEDGIMIPGRMPVPISMWIPFSNKGTVAVWGHPGVTRVHDQLVAHLICYEQLLIWPVLRSMVENPDVLLGVANVWWADRTTIPDIQRQVINVWGRLFAVPVVFAANN